MTLANKKILLIEDERELAEMIKKYLEREQAEVFLCDRGDSAMAIFERCQPDLLLLDLMLPGKDGLDILREVRLKETLPIIILSAKETEIDRLLGLKMGADDYLTKPFSIKELIVRIETIFRRMEQYSTINSLKNRLKYQHFTIDLAAREVLSEQTIIPLTTKEYNLYEFLLRHPKQVFSKAQLYDNVWGVAEYGDMNTVTIHIQKLREKLGPANGITTIRGIGYRFDGGIR
ncbi:DNA-binding response regulator [Enterococcus sp. JM4C]|uniref:response regulator transcription factor n=1 Tax=Candidatus Enterococcus huntleyi TaxID=1857217 RepID=UPI001379D721|nr:response regulator transcription factor [Enterococcus sp. JM4C]KAF1297215.1 DNA-binding response regulator [Enterococcus sp. JM4C]